MTAVAETEEVCCVCGLPEDNTLGADGFVTRELAPYGPGGKPICFGCAMSTPELEKTAKEQYGKKLDAAGPVAILDRKGPRALSRRERRMLRRPR
jgi:hypothetical protein